MFQGIWLRQKGGVRRSGYDKGRKSGNLASDVAEASIKVRSTRFESAERRHSSGNECARACESTHVRPTVHVYVTLPSAYTHRRSSRAGKQGKKICSGGGSKNNPTVAQNIGMLRLAYGSWSHARVWHAGTCVCTHAHACMQAHARVVHTGGISAPFGDRRVATTLHGVRRRGGGIHEVHACTHHRDNCNQCSQRESHGVALLVCGSGIVVRLEADGGRPYGNIAARRRKRRSGARRLRPRSLGRLGR
jgi:hypothetical protein